MKTSHATPNPTTVEDARQIIELTKVLSHQSDLEEILRLVSDKMTTWLQTQASSIMMINPSTRHTLKTVVREGTETNEKYFQNIQTNVSGWMIRHLAAFQSIDISKDERFTKGLFKDLGGQSVLGCPLVLGGVAIGSIVVLCKVSSEAELLLKHERIGYISHIIAPFLRNAHNLEDIFASRTSDSTFYVKYTAAGLLGKSRRFLELLKSIEAAANCDVRVLLEGKSGTGKELVAHAIHRYSSRVQKPFIALDCGAIPPNLVESELFGHVKGAFTGAATPRKGLFEAADGGTLFMDEIANLPLDVQSKLMRVLQEGEIRPVGSNSAIKVNVRIIAAGSVSLRKLVEEEKFREDLFYRLHVYPIEVPSLSERQEDIPILANHFLAKFAAAQGKQVERFDEDITDFMKVKSWSGNVRELENFVERLVTIASAKADTITRKTLPPDLMAEFKKYSSMLEDLYVSKSLSESLTDYEMQIITHALDAHGGNQSKTARSLKISEQTLRYKMKKLGKAKNSE